MPIFFGAIADDDTGATDLAGMLTEQGMRVVVIFDGGPDEQLEQWTQGCEAVVMGTASRSIAKQEAYRRTFSAVTTLIRLGARVLAVKYCSTFDSTTEGNIGASIDAAMDATGERFTVALPALPALGRTTYMGYHFVHDKLLSDSPLRHHPLNPMDNPHLPSHLQSQTSRSVGLVAYPVVAGGVPAVRDRLRDLEAGGVQIALFDCVDDAQLRVLSESVWDRRLLTGSSAWGIWLPQIWYELGMWHPKKNDGPLERISGGRGHLIVSGSCAEATAAQNAWAVTHGIQVFALDPIALAQGSLPADGLLEKLASCLSSDATCLLTSAMSASSKQLVHAWAEGQQLSPVAVGQRIGEALAQIVHSLFQRAIPKGLIIAGGETSSTLMRTLKLGGMRIGPTIDRGVPVGISLALPQLGVALKSGNFGSQDFYARAIDAMEALPTAHKEEVL